MRGIINAVWLWIWNLWPWSRWKLAYVEDAPENPKLGRVYIVGGRQHPFQAVMDCPCGCGNPIWLDLVPGDGEHWTITAGKGEVASLKPSVWRTAECRSHFVLKSGRIRWC
jgi:hypothetical protein